MMYAYIAIAVLWIVLILVLIAHASSSGRTWDDELPRSAEVPIAGDPDAWRAMLNTADERDEP